MITLAEAALLIDEQVKERKRRDAEHQEEVERWVREHTCPHCGECPPIPERLDW